MGLLEVLFIASLIVVIFGFRHLSKIGGYLGRTIVYFKKGLRGEKEDRTIREVNPKNHSKDGD